MITCIDTKIVTYSQIENFFENEVDYWEGIVIYIAGVFDLSVRKKVVIY